MLSHAPGDAGCGSPAKKQGALDVSASRHRGLPWLLGANRIDAACGLVFRQRIHAARILDAHEVGGPILGGRVWPAPLGERQLLEPLAQKQRREAVVAFEESRFVVD